MVQHSNYNTNINYLLIVITLILVMTGFACQQEKADYAIIRGTVSNGKKSLKLLAAFGTDNEDKTISLDTDGSFNDTIYTKEGQYNLFDGENMIGFYIKPDQEYIIHYDVKQFTENGMQLRGDDTAYNNYFTKKSQHRVFINPYEKTSELEIRAFLNEIKQNQLKRLAAAELPQELKAYERTEFDYEYLVFLRLCIKSVNIAPSATSLRELDIDYHNEEHYEVYGPYKRLVDDHYRGLLADEADKKRQVDTSYSEHQNAMSFYAAAIPNEFIRNQVIAQHGLFHCKNADNIQDFYRDFNTHYTGQDSIFLSKMLDLYSRLSKLERGHRSPTFVNYTDYQGGTHSMDDFLGKNIYLNLWATWCMGCYSNMPVLNQLTQQYKNENIVFLNIAWKNEEAAWRKVVAKEDLAGVQLLGDQEDNSFFVEYGVYGVPRYILIDAEGKVVDYNAPSPSDKDLPQQLDELLNHH